MNDNDIKKLRGVIREEVASVVKKEVSASEQRLNQRLDNRVALVGESLIQKLEKSILSTEQRLEVKIKQLGNDIGDLISKELLPQIAEKADKTDIERLERKIDRAFDKDMDQDRRLDRIESVPIVALELKKPRKR